MTNWDRELIHSLVRSFCKDGCMKGAQEGVCEPKCEYFWGIYYGKVAEKERDQKWKEKTMEEEKKEETPQTQAIERRDETMFVVSSAAMDNYIQAVEETVKKLMTPGVDFGKIPGVEKDFLEQPGAEKLAKRFLLVPKYTIQLINLANDHREYDVTCDLLDERTSRFRGQGAGCCSTMETKYRYREQNRKCPACGSETIIKGRQEYGGGWLCYVKKGGCGAKFADGDKAITEQKTGRIENPDIADVYHTVKLMAMKRAFVKGVRTATMSSNRFTQDAELVNGAHMKQSEARVKEVKKVIEDYVNPPEETKSAVEPLSEKQAAFIITLKGRLKIADDTFESGLMQVYGVKAIKELDTAQAKDLIDRMLKRCEEKKAGKKAASPEERDMDAQEALPYETA